MMLKNLFFNALFFTFLSAVYCSRLVAISDYGSPVIGVSLGFLLDADNIVTFGHRQARWAIGYEKRSDYGHAHLSPRKDYSFSWLAGWEIAPGIIPSVEFGNFSSYFSPIDSSLIVSNINSSNIHKYNRIGEECAEFLNKYFASRLDLHFNVADYLNVMVGAYVGVANSILKTIAVRDTIGHANNAQDVYYLDGEFQNIIFGSRVGLSYKISDSTYFNFNYLLKIMPNNKHKLLLKNNYHVNQGAMSIIGYNLVLNSLEAGLSWAFGALE